MRSIRLWIERHSFTAAVVALLVGLALGAGGMTSASRDIETKLADERRSHRESKDRFAASQAQLSEIETELADTRAESASFSDELKAMEVEFTALRSKRPLPNLIGKTQSAVKSLADEYGWELEVGTKGSERPKGTILEQSPSPGTRMKYGGRIQVTVAKPLPPGWKDIKVFTGSGEITTPEMRIPSGKVRILYSFSGSTNAQITMYERPNVFVDNFLNEIGNFSASTRIYYSGRYYFEFCCGSWTVRIQEWR